MFLDQKNVLRERNKKMFSEKEKKCSQIKKKCSQRKKKMFSDKKQNVLIRWGKKFTT
jgi:hypothetical protein